MAYESARLAAHPRRTIKQTAPFGPRRAVVDGPALTAPRQMSGARARDAPASRTYHRRTAADPDIDAFDPLDYSRSLAFTSKGLAP